MRRFPLIRLAKKDRLFVFGDLNETGKLTIEIVQRRTDHPESTDNEHWLIRGAELTPAAARRLRDYLNSWLREPTQ